MMSNRSRVRCMECGERIPRNVATPVRDTSGNLLGYLCRECELSA